MSSNSSNYVVHKQLGRINITSHFKERSEERLGSVDTALELLRGAKVAPLSVVRHLGTKVPTLEGEIKTYLMHGDIVFVVSKRQGSAPQYGVRRTNEAKTIYISQTPLALLAAQP